MGICQTMLLGDIRNQPVPGGVLVFFPSYSLLESMLSLWRETKIYDEMVSVCKAVVEESRLRKTQPPSNFRGGNKNLDTNEDSDTDDDAIHVESIVSDFHKAISKHSKCLLLAVCRGKVSEGIDFKDNFARAVVLVGIPFAPYKDPRVRQKQKYLDEKINSLSHFQSWPIGNKFQRSSTLRLSGREWYNQSAIRAVNQAVGRIIRHKKDWGAVFLLDER